MGVLKVFSTSATPRRVAEEHHPVQPLGLDRQHNSRRVSGAGRGACLGVRMTRTPTACRMRRTSTVHFASRSQMTTWCARRPPSSGSGRVLAPGAMKTPSGLQDEEEPVVRGKPERRPHVCREEVPASSLAPTARARTFATRWADPVPVGSRGPCAPCRSCLPPPPDARAFSVRRECGRRPSGRSHKPSGQSGRCLPASGQAGAHPPGHVSPLPGDQTAMPAHQRIGGDARGDGVERPSPEEPGRRRQSTTLTVRQPELPATTRLVEGPGFLSTREAITSC